MGEGTERETLGTYALTPPGPVGDERAHAAWRVWLAALATDPEAAFAAALVYQSLDGAGRELWLSALDQDIPKLAVPHVAVYAPLIAVETDPIRRRRMESALLSDPSRASTRTVARALRGVASNGDLVIALVLPLYLDFVRVIACRCCLARGFEWVRQDPITRDIDAPRATTEIDGVGVEQTPIKLVIDELGRTILAHRRSGRALPEALQAFVSLFDHQAPDEHGTSG